MAQQELDPITLQVISGALDTIAEEMGHILYRMSFSSIIRESQDLGAGLFDTDFNTLCESESTPLHIGSLPGYLAGIQESLQGGKWNDGDVVIHNHPYYGSSHSPDIAIVIPVFHKGELVAYSANTAHHLDIGAATPGLIIDIPDVYAEGMLFAGHQALRGGACATRRCGSTSGATAAPRASSRTILTPRSRRPGSGCGVSASCWSATAWTPCSPRPASSWTTPSGCCASASPRFPMASTVPRASSTTTAGTATCGCPSRSACG